MNDRLRQLESIYNALTDVVFSLSVESGPRYRFESVNKAFLSVTGLSEDQVVGKYVDQVIPEPSLRLVLEKYAQAIRENRLIQWEEISDYPTGRLTGQVSVMPIFDESGSCKTLVGTVHDVTAYKKALTTRDEFMSVASHELKTPITALRLQADLRLRHLQAGKSDRFTRDELERIFESDRSQLDRLVRLVDEMLDVTRIHSGRLILNRDQVDLNCLVYGVIYNLRLILDTAGSEVLFNNKGEVIGHWDSYRLEQVVENLLTNAAKFGAGKPIEVQVLATPGEVELRVTDRGIGIDPKEHERIFGRFERVHNGSSAGGLGLGLFIAREIVQAHGGKIRVESRLGDGATFIVTLPRQA